MPKRQTALHSPTAIVFNIVHGSFVDGYGVRTTLFLKGCPLKCIWCCNPEGQLPKSEIKYIAAKCNGCRKCLQICTVNAISSLPGHEGGIVQIDRTICNNCGDCISVCDTDALSWFGREMTVNEAFNILRKDERYFSSSGGGITIGGGEPSFQHEFTYALMKRCQSHYIHVAIDTCGYATNDIQFKILAEADLLLYDFKGLDPVKHQKHTGVSNDVILANLEKLAQMGRPIIIRIPLVPRCNDSREEVEQTAAYLSSLRTIQRIDLLPYHNYGIVKYEQLGWTYDLPEAQRQPDAYINEIMSIFQNVGLKTQIGG